MFCIKCELKVLMCYLKCKQSCFVFVYFLVGYLPSQHTFYFLSLSFISYLLILEEETILCTVLVARRTAGICYSWKRCHGEEYTVTGGVNAFEICLSSCCCNGHSTICKMLLFAAKAFCTFGSVSSTVVNAVCMPVRQQHCMGQCVERYCIFQFMACL